ncbi:MULTISPECIES: DNA topology modulation protein [unclassified Streptococcus]|uniref:DNA topology modulation protein n=1 Tax=unclassified Streptococcus TaxID=2608887 RepID=UPI001071788D|nr:MULTISPECIES: DNA topology modulation protein [unclassified Streptococcus]MBF0786378.1 DNA topology modulation protein [Streptococcus sp. 19428wC2_LYSM12]MCQ9212485.1 DNA topology modulation protein [Streptococcus sp. B01]MCQ9213824.1 DNA topology modulation protein [Streptococcus sp. O1]TFV06787.1 DNA topology modulation protein [Streptococcus sp. LYSM12]
MKIAIIGYSASGKSTLATYLSKCYKIPCLHLDRLRFLPNWQKRSDEDMRDQLQTFLENESWIIEGNYRFFCYQERMEQADQIILMTFSRWNCLFRAFKRYLRYAGRVRDSMAEGCRETLDWAFIRWILKDGRSPNVQIRHQIICQTYADKVIILHNQKELDDFMHAVKGSG